MNTTTALNRAVHVLAVEDNPGDARLITEFLTNGALKPVIAFAVDGEDGLAYLLKQGKYASVPTPDLILLDLNLPRMDGRLLLEQIKARTDLRNIPVLVLTTSCSAEDIHRSYELQANCFITKPADLAAFNAVMKSIESFWFSVVSLPTHPGLSIAR